MTAPYKAKDSSRKHLQKENKDFKNNRNFSKFSKIKLGNLKKIILSYKTPKVIRFSMKCMACTNKL